MRQLLICFLIVLGSNAFSQDTLRLGDIRHLLSGKWTHGTRVSEFRYEFDNDSMGTWHTTGIISTAPLFKVYKENSVWTLGSIDMLGSGEPYPFTIETIAKSTLILRDKKTGKLTEYTRK